MPNWDRRSRADGATTLGTKARKYAYILPSSRKVSVIAVERVTIRGSSEKTLLSRGAAIEQGHSHPSAASCRLPHDLCRSFSVCVSLSCSTSPKARIASTQTYISPQFFLCRFYVRFLMSEWPLMLCHDRISFRCPDSSALTRLAQDLCSARSQVLEQHMLDRLQDGRKVSSMKPVAPAQDRAFRKHKLCAISTSHCAWPLHNQRQLSSCT